MTNRHHPPKPDVETITVLAESSVAVSGGSDDPLAPVVDMAAVPETPEAFIERITFEDEVYGLRLAGKSLLDIANHLTIKTKRRWVPSEVEAIVVAAAQMRMRSYNPSIEVQVDADRIDRMIQAVWDEAQAGNFAAIDRVEKLSRRKAEIMGTDAATASASVSMGAADTSSMTTEELKTLKELMEKAGMTRKVTVTGKVR